MSTELTKPGSGPLVVPDFLKDVKGNAGLEKVGKEDIVLPRLSTCQSTSPQRKKTKTEFIEGLEEGQMFNTVTKDNYGTDVTVIPIIYSRSRIYFKPLTEGGGIICQSFNGIDGGKIAPACDQCPNSKFEGNNAPKCNVFMNVVALLLREGQEPEPIILSFKSMELKAARAWVTLMKSRNKPSFAQMYKVNTIETSNTKGTFFVRQMNWVGFVPTLELYQFAEAAYNSLKDRVISTDAEPDGEEHDDDPPF